MIRRAVTSAFAIGVLASAASAAPAAPGGMIYMSVNTVADYARWRAFFDATADRRAQAGLTECTVRQTVGDPDQAVVMCAMADAAKAKASATDKAFVARLTKAGLLKRDVYFLNAPR